MLALDNVAEDKYVCGIGPILHDTELELKVNRHEVGFAVGYGRCYDQGCLFPCGVI